MARIPQSAPFDPSRYRPRNWAERHQFAVLSISSAIGILAFWALRHFKLTAWPGLGMGLLSLIALYPWQGIVNSPSRHRKEPRTWKQSAAAILFALILLAAAYWIASRIFGK